MGDRFSKKGALLSILLMAVFALLQATGQTQDRVGKARTIPPPGRSASQSDTRDEDSVVHRLGLRLKHVRSIGDLESAARIFAQLFPTDAVDDPAIAAKTAAASLSSQIEGAVPYAKEFAGSEGTSPVFISPEHEKNPSADVRSSDAGDMTIFSAAEQWAGDWPRDIRIRKSSDRGLTWPDTMVMGDGRAWTHPSLRQVSDDSFGMAFVKDWDAGDGDIFFARLTEDLATDAEFPVALSRADQRSPSVATDRTAYPAPYVYIVYAERDGQVRSVKFRASQDLGTTWSRAMTIGSFSGPGEEVVETAIAFDPDLNALHVAYTCPQGLSTGIAVATSSNFGASWSRPVFVTHADDRSDSCPRIAAKNRTVIVVYEHGDAESGRDIGLATSTDSGRRWTMGMSLASTAAEESSPDVRASDGTATFFASYVEENARVLVLSCEASEPGAWTTESAYQEDAGSVALGPVVVLPMRGPGGAEFAGAIWARRITDSDIYFGSGPIPLILASLTVTSQNQDVPYTAGTTTFAVAKSGTGRVDWTATVASGQAWLTIASGASGSDAGTITAAFLDNPDPDPRTASIQVNPADAGIPSVVSAVTQAGAVLLAGALSVTPTGGLVSTGLAGGPFTPSSQAYTLRNSGNASISWTAAKTQTWTTLSSASGTLSAGASTTVTVSINAGANALAAGAYSDTVTFTNATNGNGNTTRAVTLTVTAPGALSVTPTGGLISTGLAGGPFTPSSQAYTLRNTGGVSISWTAAKTQTWTTLSSASGTLAAGATATVTVSINAGANALAAGAYSDTVTFSNTTNGNGNTTRVVSLTVAAPGVLSVTPAGGFVSSGYVGGPFTPSSQDYTLQNAGGAAISWTAAKTQTWTTLSAASGTLAAGASTTVTISINNWANALSDGTYNDTVTFTNTTNGNGTTTRAVGLTIRTSPALSVTPDNRDVPFLAGTTTFAVSNSGGGTMGWTAAVVAGGDWLTIPSGTSGTNAGTITAAFSANRTASPRVGMIRVTAAGATGSPKDVTVTQSKGSITLGLSAERLVEKAWIIQRPYGKLTVTIVNPASVPVDKYVIYRKIGALDYQVLAQVAGSAADGSSWTYNDAFLENGTAYSYRVAALDALGNVISESNAVTI